MAIEQLAYRAYSTLPEDHIRREAGKVSAYGVKDSDIKIELLLGGEKMVNEGLREAVLIDARLHQNNTKVYWGNRSPPPTYKKTHYNQGAGATGNQATLRVTATMEVKQNNQHQNQKDGPPRDQVTEKEVERVANK
jgi:hypothetical protein